MTASVKIAYFSMEIGLDTRMHTYSGGLGILAGDMMRSAADLRIPIVGVTLLHRLGYVRQHLAVDGEQTDETDPWNVEEFLEEMPSRTTVTIEGRILHLRAWRYTVRSASGSEVPIFFLDAKLPEENSPWDCKQYLRQNRV